MLQYTFNVLLSQEAFIQRNVSINDAYGSPTDSDWVDHLQVACRVWWAKGSSTRSPSRTYISAAREASLSVGGILMPLGVDVTQDDRISAVYENGVPWVNGDFTITAVLNHEDHIECEVFRTDLGAS